MPDFAQWYLGGCLRRTTCVVRRRETDGLAGARGQCVLAHTPTNANRRGGPTRTNSLLEDFEE